MSRMEAFTHEKKRT